MKAIFLVNARSGVRRHDLEPILAGAGETIPCQRKEDLDAIIDRALAQGVEVVYAVGGDGTVHEVAKRLIGKPIALGILPTGSGNGFAFHLGIPADPRLALEQSRSGTIESIDVAEVNGMPFVGVMGLGLDAEVAHRFAESGMRGLSTYVKEGLRAFSESAPERYTIEIDGVAAERSAVIVAVANSSQYGHHARIAPIASLQDGLLNVVVIDDVPLVDAPSMLARLFTGTIDRSKHVSITEARSVKIRRPAAGPAHLDGEPVILPAELHVRVIPRALRVLVPAGAKI
jgi:diacylglycerol kinase (ATP)